MLFLFIYYSIQYTLYDDRTIVSIHNFYFCIIITRNDTKFDTNH